MLSGKIRKLPPHVAERIAAGEMIERPASIVKELVENSLDAGCTEVCIHLEQGGKGLIEVLDNGCGMSPEDLDLSVERHATSKLQSLEDLEKIATLGFRGEALPSIAAVSDVSILSRSKGAESAYELNLGDLTARLLDKPKPQKVTFGQFIDSPHGTRIRALGLFSQIPARLKFLKSQGAEVSQVREWIERLAIAYPQVGFQLVSDDRSLVKLRPQTQEDRVKAILSEGDAYPLISVTHEQDGFRDLGFQARLYWLQGSSSPNSRNLIQVVNLRAVRDRLLQQAILAPFRQALLPGQFPSIALIIDVNPSAIDVNVHPTKTEIRFLENRKVFQSIEAMVKKMIAQKGAPAIAFPSFEGRTSSFGFAQPQLWKAKEPQEAEIPTPSQSLPAFSLPLAFEKKDNTPLPSVKAPPLLPFPQARWVGSLFHTYIVYEGLDELILIDQHAAHERIRYEKLRQRFRISPEDPTPRELPSQALLIPEIIKIPEDASVSSLACHLSGMSKLGFEAEIFGEDSLIFRAVPTEWGTRQLKIRLRNLVDRILAQSNLQAKLSADALAPDNESADKIIIDENLFESLASEACHSAVRAGDPLENEEIESLMQDLFQCEHPWNCPHGRPTVVKIPQGRLEEWFQRKV